MSPSLASTLFDFGLRRLIPSYIAEGGFILVFDSDVPARAVEAVKEAGYTVNVAVTMAFIAPDDDVTSDDLIPVRRNSEKAA
jgi:hypothetical protein